ncbi:leucine-rich repeat-containing protein 43 isoform X3 [Coturnix japonica]|uniref:leucine-rich repeat-containing protein 43 isoform X3 n=1 Tax=Coturnix japonica TaxID=93934 RepID=UPI0013A5DE2D|nr:leucine-rich repeat-containing protein 43 isoform X3 [Coturnix japonica]
MSFPSNGDALPRAREFLHGSTRPSLPLGCCSETPAASGPAGLPLRPGQLGSSGQEDERPLGEESPEALLELLSDPRSPWALPPGCSAQDQHLRDVAVLDPQLTQGSRVFKLFRSLRITGKDVEEVDKDLLQLQNLEELILCTNQISRITSANLPRTLKLSSLKKLRILLLQGNPLALIPAYRGFVVDSLPKLSFFDDIHIELDERYQFRGLSKQPEVMKNEARVVVSIGEMKGVPDPSTLQELEIGSEEPVITYSYCVTYEFAGEETEDGGTEVENLQNPAVATPDLDNSAQDVKETKGQEECAATEDPAAHTAKVFVTPGEPWADTIDCNYRKEHIAKDLLGLKDYLRAGTVVSVVEEKVLWWPVSDDTEETAVESGKEKKEKQGTKKGSNKGAGTKDKQKKKKKEKPRELRSDPPIRRILGSQRVALETLLATETLVATVCDFGVLITEQLQQSPSQEEKLDKKKSKDKSKRTKAKKESQKATEPAKAPSHLYRIRRNFEKDEMAESDTEKSLVGQGELPEKIKPLESSLCWFPISVLVPHCCAGSHHAVLICNTCSDCS